MAIGMVMVMEMGDGPMTGQRVMSVNGQHQNSTD